MRNRNQTGFVYARIDLLFALFVLMLIFAIHGIPLKSTEVAPVKNSINGPMSVEMQWDSGSLADIDVWFKTPEDTAINFERASGAFCDLVRDDLGALQDFSRDEELILCRDIKPGEYIVNTMLYNDHGEDKWPQHVNIRVKVSGFPIITKSVTIDKNDRGKQITVTRFKIDDHKFMVPGSDNDLHKDID